MTVAVVTDSAADLPPSLASRLHVRVVPLAVQVAGASYRDGKELPPERFWELAAAEVPTTASPSPGEIAEAYASGGAGGIVSIHIAETLSRTVQTARLAAAESGLSVEVLDSGTASLGQGLIAAAAAEVAMDGGSLDAVAEAARDAAARIEVYATLETVEFLARGGRVGAASAALAGLLRIRPVLTMEGGTPRLLSRCRTRSRAMQEVMQRAAGPAAAVGVAHAMAADVGEVVETVRAAFGLEPVVAVMGAAVGTHLGPGAVAIAVLRPAGGSPRGP